MPLKGFKPATTPVTQACLPSGVHIYVLPSSFPGSYETIALQGQFTTTVLPPNFAFSNQKNAQITKKTSSPR